jgi:hypothetical protein
MTALDRLSQIIPPDQALANKALSVALQQITNISSLNLPRLANAVSNVQTNFGLPLVNAQTSAVDPAVANSLVNTLGTGSGPSGTITINDSMGIAAGVVVANAIANTITLINSMDLSDLVSIYNDIQATASGTYGPPEGPIIIATGPAVGTYDNINAAFSGQMANMTSNSAGGNGLIPSVNSNVIPTLITTYPSQTANLNTNWNNMMTQLNSEKTIQESASVQFANLLPNSNPAIYSFVISIPSYGQDTSANSSFQYLESVADLTTLGGQSLVAALRQGQTNINATGIATTSNVPVDPNPPPPEAALTPSQYPYPLPPTS